MSTDQKVIRLRLRLLGLALGIALTASLLVLLRRVQRVQEHLDSAQMAAGQIESALGSSRLILAQLAMDPDQVASLHGAVETLDADVAAVENLAGPLLRLSPYLGWLPAFGTDVQAAPRLLALARHATDTALALADGLEPWATNLNPSGPSSGYSVPEALAALQEARSHIEEARESLAQAKEARKEIDADQLTSGTRTLLTRLDRYLPLADAGVEALTILPDLLGQSVPQTYLLVAQNNHELRATGGFISGVGLVRVEGGEITELDFRDSYALDDLSKAHAPAPGPLRRYMGADLLLLRDANWWPDYPTSARAIADLYLQDSGQKVDGVIAFDLGALDLLLRALGPIEVPGYEQPVSSANLEGMLMSYWQAPRLSAPGKEGTDWWLHRKDFSADLMSALLTRTMEGPSTDVTIGLAQALGQALAQRHILVYMADDEAQAFLREMNWDGSLRASPGDYLMVVDSNVGFNKVDPLVERTADLNVDLDSFGMATVRLSLSYRHLVTRPTSACEHEPRYGQSYADLMERCYWSFLRLYLPAGSELLAFEGVDSPPEIYRESGHEVVAAPFVLATGQARTIEVAYRIRLRDSQQGYELLVQKQPGTSPLPLRITVNLPEGATLRDAAPAGMAWLQEAIVWQGVLNEDLHLALSYESTPTAPQ